MVKADEIIKPLLKDSVTDIFGGEDLLIEAARDLIKEELKDHIKEKLNEHPALKKEFKDAIGMYYEAKIKEMFASIKLVKASAKLGLELMPDKLKKEMSKELEQEINKLIEKTL
jgi:hypothetical protein